MLRYGTLAILWCGVFGLGGGLMILGLAACTHLARMLGWYPLQ